MKSAAMSLDLILNTVSANHQVNKTVENGYLFNELILILVLAKICQINQVSTYIPLLAKRGVLVQLGLVLEPHQVRLQQDQLDGPARISLRTNLNVRAEVG